MKSLKHPSNNQTLNPSNNSNITEIIEQVQASRRDFMKGAAALGALGLASGIGLAPRSVSATPPGSPILPGPNFGGIGFDSIPPNLRNAVTGLLNLDAVSVPTGYSARLLFAWGDSVSDPTLVWNPSASQGEAEQIKQAGMHHDGMHYFPVNTRNGPSSERGLLCVNHEYTHEGVLHPDGLDPTNGGLPTAVVTLAKVRKSQAAHGVSVIEIRKVGGVWQVVRPSPFGRRITGNTRCAITGPAAGHALLRTPADPSGTAVLGTLNNCAAGKTPWGTYLTCEENWNGYFGTSAAGFTQTANERRFGVTAGGFNYKWHTQDPRFDVRAGGVPSNEPNRFGWVVEIDPYNPNSVPKKRTALGRTKHESAAARVAPNGKVVVYMGDDERNEYIYKFVSSGTYNPSNRGANMNLLDSGTLYVAKFTANPAAGSTITGGGALQGEWLPLVWNQNGLTPANGFTDQGDVLIRCRQAADRVGATMMDRPEWTAIHPTTGEVYITLTNNNRRGSNPHSSNNPDGSTSAGSARPAVDAANPRADNRYGHIVRWLEDGGDATATTFSWNIFVECGDSLDVDANHKGNISDDPAGSCDYGAPDGLWVDAQGRVWIQTDQAGDGAGDWINIGGNVMVCANPNTGETRRFLTSPHNCEVTGIDMTPDGKTMFINIQHPGEDSTAANPTQFSSWPASQFGGPSGRPRAATVVITRNDGGVVGGL